MSNIQNTNAWEPVQSDVTSCPNCRSPERYAQVVAELDVQNNPRYAKRDGNTYCSTFLWDFTRAMGAEIPHWWLGHEMNANAVHGWLYKSGAGFGWNQCQKASAVAAAKAGAPAIVIWKNPSGGPGHVAVVLPSSDLEVRIAQAGSINFADGPLSAGFGKLPVEFWSHV